MQVNASKRKVFGKIYGAYQECARYTDIVYQTNYYWNISHFENTIATGVPNTGFLLVVDAFEDDDQACVALEGDDYLGSKSFALSGYGQDQLTSSPGDLVFQVRSAAP